MFKFVVAEGIVLPGGRDRSFVAGFNTQESVSFQDCNTAKTNASF